MFCSQLLLLLKGTGAAGESGFVRRRDSRRTGRQPACVFGTMLWRENRIDRSIEALTSDRGPCVDLAGGCSNKTISCLQEHGGSNHEAIVSISQRCFGAGRQAGSRQAELMQQVGGSEVSFVIPTTQNLNIQAC